MTEQAVLQDARRYLAMLHKRRGIVITCLGVSLAIASGVLLLRGRRLRGRRWQGLVIVLIVVDLLLFGVDGIQSRLQHFVLRAGE